MEAEIRAPLLFPSIIGLILDTRIVDYFLVPRVSGDFTLPGICLPINSFVANQMQARKEVIMANSDQSVCYNLLDESWISVVYENGTANNVSLIRLFEDAPRIRSISGEMPQMYFATVRLALAVLYRAYEFLDTSNEALRAAWKAIWDQGAFDMDYVAGYLQDYRDRFELFDVECPFYQVANLAYMGKDCDSVSELMPEIPKPDKFLFSMRAPQSVNRLERNEAARYLVLAHAFDVAGIKTPVEGNSHVNKGKVYAPKGAVGTGWCGAIGGVFLEGNNLFQTLMLNWVLYDGRSNGFPSGEDDAPPWEEPIMTADLIERNPVGIVDMLTWQSRRVRLVPDEEADGVVGVVMCYGDVMTAVDKQRFETMTAWRESKQQQKKLNSPTIPWMPVTFDSGKALWRGLSPLLSAGADEGGSTDDLRPGVVRWAEELVRRGVLAPDWTLSIRAQGMTYGTQSSVYEEGIDDYVNLRALLFQKDAKAADRVVEVVGQTDAAVNELAKFVANMEIASGDKRRSTDSTAKAFKDDVRDRAYGELDGLFREEIANFTAEVDPPEYCDAWRERVRAVLRSIARSYVDSAGRSMFAEHGDMTAGKAVRLFRWGLAKALGTTSPAFDTARSADGE